MDGILELFCKNKNIHEVINCSKKDVFHLYLTNCSDNHRYLLSSKLLDDNFVIYIASNTYKATKAYDSISKVIGYENVNLYVSNEIVATEVDATNKEFSFERMNTISSIIKREKKVIVTTIQSALKELCPIDVIKENIITLKKDDTIDRKQLIKQLIKLGYKKVPTTNAVGYFSVRGEVIDVYPINVDYPIRLDFFDDEIESIKKYDKDSQLTIKDYKIDEITIYPNTEIIYDNPDEIISRIDTKNEYNIINDIENIKNYTYSEKLNKYLHYIYNRTESLLDYIDNKIVIYEDEANLKDSYDKTITELTYFLNTSKKYEHLDLSYFFDYYKAFDNEKTIITTELGREECSINPKDLYKIDINGYSIPNYHNNVKALLEDINTFDNLVYFTFSKEENINIVKEILISKNIECNNKNAKVILKKCDSALSFGFYNDIKVIDETSIFNKLAYNKSIYRSAKASTSQINSKDDLKPGDYVVHYNYGIGQYLGIKEMTTGNYTNDYIKIKFGNIDLYIPVENIIMLEKYEAEEGYVPKLTNVGTGEWEKKKKKIKDKLENIARDLLLLQAFRETKQGYKYDKDDDIQIEFENDFEYQETKDQLLAINDIKKDMEDGKIVDRLVCGDVGFGKTEVAIRIAMKTVLNGKQVAYLAPTTILTRQHYFTFKERMEKYGIHVALLNRLISTKAKNQIIKDLKSGNIDIVIGTHVLLNDLIQYKDLGLLIIDEEQRFGVTHKEKIKQLKNNINVVTLTATPIPRTLQMSLSGARQMSLIETSPLNRYPIQTYVLEENDAIIREAIYNEIGRDGQVFIMHNRIEDLDRLYMKLKKLVPEAKIIVAHGQMDKNELEDSIQSFIDREYNVLLCTSIIETGIDIPNTNTIIVTMADRLGLSQMYQIRGRVGRTNRVSYAYFMYDRSTILTKEGEQRLNAIKEFTALGSGYKIAVRDLAIRGAGDLLGKEQSGYIDAIGMDLYMKLLSESMNEVQGITEEENDKQIHTIDVSKHIDSSYVSDDDIKIYIHKLIHTIDSKEKKNEVINELTDRFGKLNDEIKLYIEKCYMDSLVKSIGIEDISENEFKGKVVFSKETSNNINAKKIMETVYSLGEDYSVEYKNKRFVVYILKLIEGKKWIYKVTEFLENNNVFVNTNIDTIKNN